MVLTAVPGPIAIRMFEQPPAAVGVLAHLLARCPATGVVVVGPEDLAPALQLRDDHGIRQDDTAVLGRARGDDEGVGRDGVEERGP